MAFIVKKKIGENEYYYLRESKREGDKVKAVNLGYLGKTKVAAEKKMNEILTSKSMEKEIKITYFVHGTTIDNEKGISTGQAQGELSDLGKKQSKELWALVKNKKFDIVFCSDLKRAIDSANLSFKGKYKIIKDKRLRECNYGELNQSKEEKVKYEDHIKKPFQKGESLIDVENRIKDFLNYLTENYNNKHIAIVAHKAPQLALEVITKNKNWEQAIKKDWRKIGKWQPGWDYSIKETTEKIKKQRKQKVKMVQKEINIEDMAKFCKRKGIIFTSGEIYGGLSGFWDFGPIGSEMKKNLKQAWWNYHVQARKDIVGIDGSIITHPTTWKASGHVDSFSDIFVKCKKCGKENKLDKNEFGKVKCECGGDYDNLGEYNLMFTTQVGPVQDSSVKSYLRPETAQLIFNNFKNVLDTSRMKLPFGIAQIGKAFRNEISPRDFLFRSREFEQMEIEYFVDPKEKCPYKIGNTEILVYSDEMQEKDKDPEPMKIKQALEKGIIKTDWHAYWLEQELLWFVGLGCNKNKFRIRQHTKDEKSHYALDTWDLEYNFPFGWKELQGMANRTDFDLKQHEKESGQDLKYFDEEKKEKFLPHVICEPSQGVERAFLVFMFDSYFYDEGRGNIVLKLHPKLSSVKAAVLPIVKNKKEFVKFAEQVYEDLKTEFNVVYDQGSSVGRRYARQDEIGTPYCITIDGDSIKNKDITIRERDTTQQIRVKIEDLKETLRKLINSEIKFSEAGKIIETRIK